MSNAIAYGSLYLDEGENFDKAKEQVDYFLEMACKATITNIFFDVIDWQSNSKEGKKMVKRIVDYIKSLPFGEIEIKVSFTPTEKTGEKPRN